jgi:hypothetical protein
MFSGKLLSVDVELLVVPDCANEAAARSLMRGVLDELGLVDTVIRTTVISTEDKARRRGFAGSPTILVDGVDPFAEPGMALAEACRVYRTGSTPSGIPDRAVLRDAVNAASDRREGASDVWFGG